MTQTDKLVRLLVELALAKESYNLCKLRWENALLEQELGRASATTQYKYELVESAKTCDRILGQMRRVLSED